MDEKIQKENGNYWTMSINNGQKHDNLSGFEKLFKIMDLSKKNVENDVAIKNLVSIIFDSFGHQYCAIL